MMGGDQPDPNEEPAVEEVLELLDAIEPVDEEVRTSTGAYLNEIGLIPLLCAEEEWALAERVQCGDAEARRALIESNLRLVVTVARAYVGRRLPLRNLLATSARMRARLVSFSASASTSVRWMRRFPTAMIAP